MRVAFLGNPPLGLAALKKLGEIAEVALVVTQTEPPRNTRDPALPVAEYATRQGWRTVSPPDAQDLPELIKQTAPDACVVAAYGRIIPEAALTLADGRWLNVHSSLLPEYRGATPVQQAILDGAEKTGATIMEVSTRLDAGSVVAQAEVPVAPKDTTASLTDKIAIRGADLLAETLPKYVSGVLEPKPQDESRATMTDTLKKADGSVDWMKDAEYLERFVRAMQPWPGAWTEADGRRIAILEAVVADGTDGPPGTFDGPPLTVSTGAGALRIKRLKPAGKGESAGDDWLRGHRGERRFG